MIDGALKLVKTVIGAAALIIIAAASSPAADNFGEQAYKAFAKNKFQEACRLASLAIKSDPGDANAYRVRALSQGRLGQFESAVRDLNQAIKINPKVQDCWTYELQAECLVDQGNFAAASKPLEKAIALKPNVGRYKMLGQIYSQLNKETLARECFTKSINLEPASQWAYVERGDLSFRMKKYQDAVDDYSLVIKNAPREPLGYNLRAKAYERMGKKDLAEKDRAQSKKWSGTGETDSN